LPKSGDSPPAIRAAIATILYMPIALLRVTEDQEQSRDLARLFSSRKLKSGRLDNLG
jgi:hypothetical protein